MARSLAQQEMIDVISSVGEEWPMALLYLTHDGANIKIQAGRSENSTGVSFDDPE